jgi:tetratricopeptide (TPR) repeat protein
VLIAGILLLLGTPANSQSEQQTLREQVNTLRDGKYSNNTVTKATALLSTVREDGNPELIFDLLNWLGDYYNTIGDYEQSLVLYREAVIEAKQTGDTQRIAQSELNIGNVYYRTGDFDRSISTYQSLINTYQSMGDSLRAGLTQASIANCYLAQSKLDTGLQLLLLARAMAEPHGAPHDWLAINQNLGAVYAEMGMPERGLPYTKESLATILAKQDTFGLAPAYGNLGYTFQQLGNFERALVYYDSSLYFSRLLKQDAITYVTLLDMSDGYLANDDYRNALKHFREYHSIQQSVLGENTRNRIAELEVLHETERKQLALETSEQKVLSLEREARLRNQRLLLFIIGLFLSLLAALLIFRQWRRDIRHRDTQEKLIASELANERLASGLLSSRLENQQEDLTDFALDIERKNKFSRELANRLSQIRKILPAQLRPQLDELIRFTQGHDQVNEQLEVVQENVDQINHEFHQKLREAFPNLTASDRTLAGLLRLNMTNKEVATNRGISTASAKMARYRLRKKLNLTPSDDIIAFLRDL